MSRSVEMNRFLDEATLALRTAATGPALEAAERMIARWQAPAGRRGRQVPLRPPVCDWIGPAVAAAGAGPRAGLATAFAGLADHLVWKPSGRRGGLPAFAEGHANATVLGPGGLEASDALLIGATVMAPGIEYPLHSHAPEEVYLSLSPGEWWNEAMDWTDPGPTGAIYNPPGIGHRMRSGAAPFLALWFLPL